ncbi:N2,N2-dimethylguanosine tRNA methyltransferase [Hortaea werneckii]|nr:N2,N2-dimethylguanosine tRNA methyltransferase [Hortaea werneckii]KAI7500562.1 N2,N2-dimethylguanosine tRNA methyltransferase [Hortaea werneckii]
MSTTDGPAPLSANPTEGQLIQHAGKTYETIREGKAFILSPPNTRKSVDPQAQSKGGESDEKPQSVFYNPIQQFNRDLSVLAIKAFGEDLCERRRQKRERDSGKVQAKKDRKKKKQQEHSQIAGNGEERSAGPKLAEQVTEAEGSQLDTAEETATDTSNGMLGGLKRKATDGVTGESRDLKRRKSGGNLAGVDGLEQNADGQQAEHEAKSADADEQGTKAVKDAAAAPPVNADHPSQEWQPRFRILDALSATGLRALRYATEIPFATSVVANDMDRNATRSIATNVEHNKLTSTIQVNTGNAIGHMYSVAYPPESSHGPNHVNAKYDVIDLDPYGTAAPFIDAALQSLNDGGLLCVTCTDSGVFASCGYPEKTYSLYGGMPVKGAHSHEGGLRIILNSIASAAARYGMAVEPLLSLSIDFYVRMFVRVNRSPADVKFLAGKTMIVYDCDAGCGAWYPQMLGRNTRQTGKGQIKGQEKNPTFNFKHSIAQAPSADRLCEHCGSKMHVAGPMWAGPIHNPTFVEKVLHDAKNADKDVYQTIPRLEGMLDTALDELVVCEDVWERARTKSEDNSAPPSLIAKTPSETVDHHPFFFIPSALSKVVHCQAPSEAAVKGALRHAGYRATRSHCKPGSVKTDAPWSAIWKIMREWVKQRAPIKEGSLKEGTAGWNIMQKSEGDVEMSNGEKDAGEGANSDGSVDVVTEKEKGANSPPPDPKSFKVVFDEALGRDRPGRRLVRYQQNPRENWGPMARAKGSG